MSTSERTRKPAPALADLPTLIGKPLLAQVAGVSTRTVDYWEAGKRIPKARRLPNGRKAWLRDEIVPVIVTNDASSPAASSTEIVQPGDDHV